MPMYNLINYSDNYTKIQVYANIIEVDQMMI